MRAALVVHPRFTLYGGGEVISLYICKVLRGMGYHVYLACDNYNPVETARHFGPELGKVMSECEHVATLGEFSPHTKFFMAYQRALHTIRLIRSMRTRKDVEFVIATQQLFNPSILRPSFCVVYDTGFFFTHGEFDSTKLKGVYYYPLKKIYQHYANLYTRASRLITFIPIAKFLETYLDRIGFSHTGYVFSPCPMVFKIKPKERYVVNVSRMIPHKKVDDFAEIARRLPEYKFVLVYKISQTEQNLYPHYAEEFLSKSPPNLRAVESLIMNCPEYVENAKVFLSTTVERGTTVSLGQAMGAGCVPVSAPIGGGAEMVEATKVGYIYKDLDDAIEKVKSAIESSISPELISERAQLFSPENFQNRIKEIIQDKSYRRPF